MDADDLLANLDLGACAELIQIIKESPRLIHNSKVRFLKSFVEEFKLPPANDDDADFDDVEDLGEAPRSAQPAPEVVRDDDEDDEDDPGLVPGDDDPPQEMGNPSVEVTDEMREAAMPAKAAAMAFAEQGLDPLPRP